MNIEEGVRILKVLREIGFENLVVRGAAFGSFGVDRQLEKMMRMGFITPEMLEERRKHEYYVVKNFLTPRAYEWIEEQVGRVHRYTYTLYSEVWGVPIAGNRGNEVRISRPTGHSEEDVRRVVEQYLDVERREDHYFVESGRPATEDIAMTVGAERRDELFEKGLEELKREAYAIIDWRDLNTLHPLCELLDILGYRTGEIAGFPNPFGSKRPILELYRRNVMRLLGTEVEEDLSGYIFHRNYGRRLEEKGIILDQRRAEVLNLVASAFRYVDDILDENTIRDYRPAFWVENGFAKTMYIATLMTVRAYSICEELGLGEEFLRMFERVIDAVNYELLVEEGLAEFRSYEDWLRVAEREAAFREFLAVLAGRPEERGAFRLWGLKAQAKDDLMGAGKGGREETEGRLRRPLFRREWLARLEHKLNEALRT